jgi:hypothetical protein
VSGSVVVDVRPEPVVDIAADIAPRSVVNLTAMRLVPAAPAPQPPVAPRRAVPAPRPVAAPEGPAEVSPSSAGVTVQRAPVVTPTQPTSGWVLAFDTGEQVPVDGVVLVGRRPEGRPGEAVRHLVSLPSQDMSLSKTHAQVAVAADGALVVMDRGSTNGSVLTRHGVSRPLSGGKPTTLLEGDVVRLGDRRMEISRRS